MEDIEDEKSEEFSNCEYKFYRLMSGNLDDKWLFKHNQVLSIRMSGNHEAYTVYVRNKELFGSGEWVELHTFALNDASLDSDVVAAQSIYDSYLFANNMNTQDDGHAKCIGLKHILQRGDVVQITNLQNKPHWNNQLATVIGGFVKNKQRWPIQMKTADQSKALLQSKNLILYENIDNNDGYMKLKEMILNAKFLWICDETRQQLAVNELGGREEIRVFEFEDIETIQFPLTPIPSLNYALYVQLEPDLNSDFVLIKTFEKDTIWKPMSSQYKPSYSTGVYGAYALKPAAHRYRASLSTGVYGVYMLQLVKPLSVICSICFMDNLLSTDDKMVFTLHAHNVDCIHHNVILNATYLMVFQDEIDHKATMTENDGIIYHFDDINHVRFLIPFNTESQYAHLYVKSKGNFDFVFVKRLQIEKRNDITNEIDYLLIALKRFDVKITNPKQFGCDVERLIPQMIQNRTPDLFTFCDKYDSTKRILDRLYEEFDAQMLLSHRTILSTKFQCVHTSKAFGYCVYKTHKADGDDAHADEKTNIFESSKYEIVCIRNHDMQSEIKQTKILDFGDELIITNRDEYDLYVISVQNEDVFNSSQYIEIQRLNKPDFSECSNAFRHHLQLMDKTIELKAPQGDYGRYDVTEGSTCDTFIINSKSKFCSIRINAALHSGKYYYEVHILKADEDCPKFYIGWADQGFIPNDAESRGVGNDCSEGNSWACNGMETWHNGKQNEAFNVNTCVCGERLTKAKKYYATCDTCKQGLNGYSAQWIWNCQHSKCNRNYYLCLKCATPHEGYWELDDTIGCAIDIDRGEISYYLNGHFIGIAFKNITFKTKQIFPVVSMLNHHKIEMKFVDRIDKGYQKVPEPELYCINPVEKGHYDEILQSKYVLRSPMNDDIGVYQFKNMNDLHFILPFKPTVSIYVQSPHHDERVLLKAFGRPHLRNYKTLQHPSLQYLLDFLAGVSIHLIELKDIDALDFFEWDHKWLPVLLTQKYRAILKQPSPLGVDIRHRLVYELHIDSVDIAFKVLDAQLVVEQYQIFEHFTLHMEANEDAAVSNCDYKLMKRSNDNQETQLHRFKHKRVFLIRMSGNHETYVVYVRNETVFGSPEWFELQTFALNCPPSDTDMVAAQSIHDPYLFVNNLEIRDVHHIRCIGLKPILNDSNNDEYMKIKETIS
eukprot:343033_1